MGTLSLVVTVRCLACGAKYVKPDGRGTVKTNPGCPECGYLGWSLVSDAVTEAGGQRRFVSDRQRLRSSRFR